MVDGGVKTEGEPIPEGGIPEVELIRNLKAKSNIIPGSGYDVLIDWLQVGKPNNIPDPMANELVRLHGDMEDIIPEIIPEEEVERASKELNAGDKERIAYLAEEVKKKYLGDEDVAKVRERALKSIPISSRDLKVLLANQLVMRIKDDYAGKLLRKRILQERKAIARQIRYQPPQD